MGSKQIRNSIIATVVGGIILSFWEPFRGYVLDSLVLAWGAIRSISWWLISVHDVYGWFLVLIVTLSIPTVIKLVFFLKNKQELGLEDLYTSDHIFGVNWHWAYKSGSIENLWCLCPICNGELVYSEFRPDPYNIDHVALEAKTKCFCEKCEEVRCTLNGDKDYALSRVKREIRRKIRNNEWRKNQIS